MPNELLPSNIQFGTVVGRFGSAPLIAGDADGLPDFSPASGLTVTFTPSTAAVIDATASPAPVTIEMVPIVCGLDSQGYLVGGDGQRGVKLIATDDTDINPSGWTYSVTFLRAGAKVAAFRDFSMSLPAGTVKDIALTIPVPSSSGVSLNQAQAAEAAAVAAASAASASASTATTAANTAVAATATKAEKPNTGRNSLTGWFHADGYGADRTGVADSGPAITAAVAAAAAAGGGIVYIPTGTFKISTTINMSDIRLPFGVGGLTLRGNGINATNLTGGEPAYGFLELVNSTGVTIEDLSMKTLTGSTQFGILGGRTAGDASSGNHRFRNILLYGTFAAAGLFMLNSEQSTYECVTVRTLGGPAAVMARDRSNWTVTAKYVALSTTVGYGGGNGVITMTGCNFLTYGTSLADVPLTLEFVQTFTSLNCYTLTTNAPSVVLSKGIYQASFVGLQQEWSGSGSEPLGFSAINVPVTGETPNVRMTITNSTVYPVLGADGVVFANFGFHGSRWRGTARTYQYDVDSSFDADIKYNPNATTISGEATAPKYRVRGSTSDAVVSGGSPILVPIGAPVPSGTPANRVIVRLFTGGGTETARNKAINPAPLTSTTGWGASSFAGTGGVTTTAAQTTGGPPAGSPSCFVYTWTTAPTSTGVYGGYGRSTNTDIACTPGDTMTFAAWIKPSWSGGTTGLRVLFWTSGGALIGAEILGATALHSGGAWERRTVTTTVPATAVRATLRTWSQNVTPTVGATLAVSSVIAETGSIGHSYFDGGLSPDARFTSSWTSTPFASESILTASSSYLQFWDGTTTWNL